MTTVAPEKDFVFREYRPADLDKLCAIDLECFPEKIAYPRETMREAIKEKQTFTVVAEDPPGEIVAFVIAGRTSPQVGHIATIDVAPGRRRCGLATRLMLAAEGRLAAAGVRKIRLETATGNVARRLFAKLGYKRVGRIDRYYPDGTDAWVMEKPVQRKAEKTPARTRG